MRHGLVLGAIGVGLFAGAGHAQFATDRGPQAFGGATPPAAAPVKPPSAPPQLPGGIQPVSHSAPAAPLAGRVLPSGVPLPDPSRREVLAPVPTSIKLDAPPHPWAVKPEHGPWMILVKGYTGPQSRVLAERMAADIRTTHKTNALLFERNAEERKAELARLDAARKAEDERNKPFLDALKKAEVEAKLNGQAFIPTEVKRKIARPYQETPEQWVVMIGGFPTMDDARKALDTVKKLPAPKDTALMDQGMVGGEEQTARNEKGEWKSTVGYLNPYPGSMVVPNPALSKARQQEQSKLEPFVVDLNKGVANSLLTIKKPYTLLVKTYMTPSRTIGQDGLGSSVFGNKMKSGSDTASILQASASEAEMLVKMLRHPNHKPRPYDAFILHHRTGSLVTVGEFDAADDPELLRMARELTELTYEFLDKDKKPQVGPDGRPLVQRVLDGAIPMPVPKY
jgi:hypothetical protein